ncbi:tRNA-specific adenosine deaminase [Pseudodesulfovibrio profundus]|uniref:tRNA-specific adenosine deaminase n=1 Tax=Pseudodesulfovibrio profundus TaxID=57320 RepID=A0A2C8F3C3_9BACT|nr:nucleoside deaminase [Pseudodesulfovibrio profundus]SOB57205.1 tRNA-specific adenosine deaminase [Pseudodesulfovibrio profundus]
MKITPPPDAPAGSSWRALMDVAFSEACKAAKTGETPVGAALFTRTGTLIAKAHNRPIGLNDPTAHAEILCLRQASEVMGNYRLNDTIMAVTLEPCLMCTGALIHARVGGIVMGALDSRAGAIISNLNGHDLSFTNHRMWYIEGVMEEECSSLLKRFFLEKRKQ